MRKKRPVGYFLLPLLYVGVILGLMVLQFSKSESFLQSWGDWTVSGRSPSSRGSGAHDLLDFQIRGQGMKFTFSAARPAVVIANDGTALKTRPVRWTRTGEGVNVLFQDGMRLEYLKSSGPNHEIVIQPYLPESLKTSSAIVLPFSLEKGLSAVRDPFLPMLTLGLGPQVTVVSLDGGGDLITEDNSFFLRTGRTIRPIRIETLKSGLDPLSRWVGVTEPTPDIKSLMGSFWTKAYAGWSNGRYHGGDWDMGNGNTRFSEVLASAYLREAFLKGDYDSAIDKATADAKTWGFRAMPYFGDLMDITQAKRVKVELEASQSSFDWTNPNLVRDALFYGPDGFADRVKKALLNDPLPTSWEGRLGYWDNLLYLAQSDANGQWLARSSAVASAVLSGLQRDDTQVFCPASGGGQNLKATMILGNLLAKYEALSKETTYLPLAQSLIAHVLAQTDKWGLFPEILGASSSSAMVRPEELFEEISPDALQEYPLNAPLWSAPAFLRSPAQVKAAVITPTQATFSFKFPVGHSEYTLIQGVPPFDHILMHGIRWRTDPNFQDYSDGWYYNSGTKTLYVKIKHRVETEDLTIVFTPDSSSS
ncbi:MAG: hypothetical protein HKM05_08830 [Spirochaetales bacterium]|nr:hypothetical protein [Spirochaetales bacterium]